VVKLNEWQGGVQQKLCPHGTITEVADLSMQIPQSRCSCLSDRAMPSLCAVALCLETSLAKSSSIATKSSIFSRFTCRCFDTQSETGPFGPKHQRRNTEPKTCRFKGLNCGQAGAKDHLSQCFLTMRTDTHLYFLLQTLPLYECSGQPPRKNTPRCSIILGAVDHCYAVSSTPCTLLHACHASCIRVK